MNFSFFLKGAIGAQTLWSFYQLAWIVYNFLLGVWEGFVVFWTVPNGLAKTFFSSFDDLGYNPSLGVVDNVRAGYATLMEDGEKLPMPFWFVLIFGVNLLVLATLILVLLLPPMIRTFVWIMSFVYRHSLRFSDWKIAVKEAIISGATGVGVSPKCQVEVCVPGVLDRVKGHGTRVENFLVIPTHVLDAVKSQGSGQLVIRTDKAHYTLRLDLFSEVLPDISVLTLSEKIWSQLGVSKPSICYEPAGMMSITVGGSSSYGTYSEGVLPHIVQITANTMPGYSGAAYMVMGTLLGVHLGNMTSKYNGGVYASFLLALLETAKVQNVEDETPPWMKQQYERTREEEPVYSVGGKKFKRVGGKWKSDFADDVAKINAHNESYDAAMERWVEDQVERQYGEASQLFKQKGWELPEEKQWKEKMRARKRTEYRPESAKQSIPVEVVQQMLDAMGKYWRTKEAYVNPAEEAKPGNSKRPPAASAGGPSSSSQDGVDPSPSSPKPGKSTPALTVSSRRRNRARQRNLALRREVARLNTAVSSLTSPLL